MCGIAGFYKASENFLKDEKGWRSVLENINTAQKHRGPNEDKIFISRSCGLFNKRFLIIH